MWQGWLLWCGWVRWRCEGSPWHVTLYPFSRSPSTSSTDLPPPSQHTYTYRTLMV